MPLDEHIRKPIYHIPMKHAVLLFTILSLCLGCTAQTRQHASTARTFVITSAEGARLTAYLPVNPSGRAIVDLPAAATLTWPSTTRDISGPNG